MLVRVSSTLKLQKLNGSTCTKHNTANSRARRELRWKNLTASFLLTASLLTSRISFEQIKNIFLKNMYVYVIVKDNWGFAISKK